MTARDIAAAIGKAREAMAEHGLQDSAECVIPLAGQILLAQSVAAAGQQVADQLAALEEQLRGIVNVMITEGKGAR